MKTKEERVAIPDFNVTLLKPLYKVRPYIHGAAMALNWVIILGTAFLAIKIFNPVTYLVAITIIGARMHALAILMHDASHYRFLKNRKWNDLITNLFTMYPFFLTIEQYRENHLQHHQHLNTEEDPDWVSKFHKKEFQFPKSKKEFLSTVFSYFLLIQGIKDAIWFVSRFNSGGNKKKKMDKKSLAKPIFYLSVSLFLSAFGLWKSFFLFWIIPYFSTFLMFQYIRSVAEHFGSLAYDHPLSSSRTVKANALEQFFIAPHNVGYHIEHHLYPGVPFYNLPKLHQLLLKTKTYKDKAHITNGYFTGLMAELA